MKKSIIVLSVLLLTASLASAFALQTSETQKQKPSISQSGEVTAVDATNNQIMIKTSDGKEITLIISGDTKITREGKAAVLADIKAGDMVISQCEDSTGGCKAMTIQASVAKPKQ